MHYDPTRRYGFEELFGIRSNEHAKRGTANRRDSNYDPDAPGFHGLDYLSNPEVFEYDDGYVDRPRGPGLGIEVDVDAVRAHDGDRDTGRMPAYNPDGSVAER